MKKIALWLTCGAAAFAALPAAGADYHNEIEVGILPLFVGYFNARYDRDLNGYFALFGGAGFSPAGYIFAEYDNDAFDWTYVNVNAGGQFFPLADYRRVFLQAEVNGHFNSVRNKSTGEKGKVFILMPGALVGWKWVVADRATLTLAAGSGFADKDIDAAGTHVDFAGIRPRLDFNLGFMF